MGARKTRKKVTINAARAAATRKVPPESGAHLTSQIAITWRTARF
jgi:hypothetical protein